jgi:uncharacterized protein (AIM24 family)
MCETTLNDKVSLRGESMFLFGDGKISVGAKVQNLGLVENTNWILVFVEHLVSIGCDVDGLKLMTPRGESVTVFSENGKVWIA